MAQTTITLSFDLAALVPDELPGPEAFRSVAEDALDGWWERDAGDPWWLQHITTTPPQQQAVNTQLLEACKELMDATAAAMRILAHHKLAGAFLAEVESMGIRDGMGIRAQAAITAAV